MYHRLDTGSYTHSSDRAMQFEQIERPSHFNLRPLQNVHAIAVRLGVLITSSSLASLIPPPFDTPAAGFDPDIRKSVDVFKGRKRGEIQLRICSVWILMQFACGKAIEKFSRCGAW